MKIVEKKCPNCGGQLEFGENDKSAKCQYCGTKFHVEKDEDVIEKLNGVVNSDAFKVSQKAVFAFGSAFFLLPIIMFIVISGTIVFFFLKGSDILPHGISSEGYVDELSEIGDDIRSEFKESSEHILRDEIQYSVYVGKNPKWEYAGSYFLARDEYEFARDSNYYIDVFKVSYGSSKEAWCTVTYKNIKNNKGKVSVDYDGDADCNDMKNSFSSFGFESDKDLYKSSVSKYESNYSIEVNGDIYKN